MSWRFVVPFPCCIWKYNKVLNPKRLQFYWCMWCELLRHKQRKRNFKPSLVTWITRLNKRCHFCFANPKVRLGSYKYTYKKAFEYRFLSISVLFCSMVHSLIIFQNVSNIWDQSPYCTFVWFPLISIVLEQSHMRIPMIQSTTYTYIVQVTMQLCFMWAVGATPGDKEGGPLEVSQTV